MAHVFRLTLAVLVLPFACLAGAVETPLGEVAFRQALIDMGTDLRLLCVAAHPDDEDGATLAMYRMRYGYKTFALIATRGEGGQNEIGPELYNELGVIRTREMQAAARVEGAELHFLDLPEFGYSKSKEETFAVWNEEDALKRMVRVIRTLRPDVIITNHGLQEDHGHHQAVGDLVLEAFDAAANREMFPELIIDEDLEPWQVTRLYMRMWNADDRTGGIAIDFSTLDSLRGQTYAEIAADALRTHTSQGMETFIDYYLTGKPKAYYRLIKEAPQDMSWAEESITPAPVIEKSAVKAQGELFEGMVDRVAPRARTIGQGSIFGVDDTPGLASALSSLEGYAPYRDTPVGREALKPHLLKHAANMAARRDKGPVARGNWQRANDAAALAAELQLRVKPSDAVLVPGQPFTLEAKLFDHGAEDAARVSYTVEHTAHLAIETVPSFTGQFDVPGMSKASLPLRVPDNQRPTMPQADRLFDEGFFEPQLTVVATVAMKDGSELELRQPVYVDIAPKVSVAFLDAPYLLRLGADTTVPIKVLLTNNAPGATECVLNLSPAPGLITEQKMTNVSFAAEGDQKVIPFTLNVGDQLSPRGFFVSALIDGQDEAVHTTVQAMRLEVPANVRIGVVQSYDDTFVNVLKKLGVPHAALTLEDFAPERLDAFTAIIVDIRAYHERADLRANNKALLDYVNRGGTLLVQYQKNIEWKEEYAPYMLKVSRNRVTDENCAMEVLVPDHPLFTTPNVIEADDWTGWIQERGLYFPDQWANEYTPLLACNDAGEDIPDGGLLVAKYGEGTYIYTALGWYRQLRELHPGATRVFANMIGLGAE